MVPINEMRAGIDSAWNAFYNECFPKVKAMLLHKGCSIHNINDLFQDAIAICYTRLVHGNKKNPKEVIHYPCAYVKRTTFNSFMNYIRDNKIDLELPDSLYDELADDEQETENENSAEKLRDSKCWKLLSERCQKILELYYFENLRDKEIAKKMGYNNAAVVKSTRYKCMNKLKKCIITS